MERRARRRRAVGVVGAVLAVALVIGVIVALTGDGDDEETASTTPPDTAPTSSVDVPGDDQLPEPAEGITLEGPTECPPPEGAAERVQVFAGPPPECLTPGASYTATFSTTLGTFTAELDPEIAPATVNNFVVLARYRYYDGVPFHRVVPGFVLQAGDGDGAPWGNNDLGYTIADELPEDSSAYEDYSLAMANSGPDTNGSQFFVVLPGGGAQLQPSYSLFGRVVEGREIVDAIGGLGTGDGPPAEDVVIDTVTITETGP